MMGIRNHKKLYSRRIPRLSGGAEEMLHTRVEARKGWGRGWSCSGSSRSVETPGWWTGVPAVFCSTVH